MNEYTITHRVDGITVNTAIVAPTVMAAIELIKMEKQFAVVVNATETKIPLTDEDNYVNYVNDIIAQLPKPKSPDPVID